MRSRRFTKKIQLWRTEIQTNEFGGNEATSGNLISSIWANLQTLDSLKFTDRDFGTVDFANSVKVTIRSNPNIVISYKTDYFIYRNERYQLTDRPFIKNFEDNTISFIMVRQNEVFSNGGE